MCIRDRDRDTPVLRRRRAPEHKARRLRPGAESGLLLLFHGGSKADRTFTVHHAAVSELAAVASTTPPIGYFDVAAGQPGQ
eukprot:12452182-Alexandrium_andersonii.AAC.1